MYYNTHISYLCSCSDSSWSWAWWFRQTFCRHSSWSIGIGNSESKPPTLASPAGDSAIDNTGGPSGHAGPSTPWSMVSPGTGQEVCICCHGSGGQFSHQRSSLSTHQQWHAATSASRTSCTSNWSSCRSGDELKSRPQSGFRSFTVSHSIWFRCLSIG